MTKERRGPYCAPCRSVVNKEWYAANRETRTAVLREQYREDPRVWMLRRAKKRAQAKGLPFSLVLDDIVIPVVCPVLGLPLKVGDERQNDCSPSLDRVDPSKGYVAGNVQVLSLRANRIKNNASSADLAAVLSHVQSHGR